MAVEKLNFLSNAGGCEPEDDKGELTSCFIEHLGYKPLSAGEALDLTFKHSREKVEEDLKPILNLIRSEAEKGRLSIDIPGSYDIGKRYDGIFEGGKHTVDENNTSIVKISTWWFNRMHLKALEELGYTVERSHPYAEDKKRYIIRWDNDNTEIS